MGGITADATRLVLTAVLTTGVGSTARRMSLKAWLEKERLEAVRLSNANAESEDKMGTKNGTQVNKDSHLKIEHIKGDSEYMESVPRTVNCQRCGGPAKLWCSSCVPIDRGFRIRLGYMCEACKEDKSPDQLTLFKFVIPYCVGREEHLDSRMDNYVAIILEGMLSDTIRRAVGRDYMI